MQLVLKANRSTSIRSLAILKLDMNNEEETKEVILELSMRVVLLYQNPSQDPITGICQSYDQFWFQIEQSYNNLKEESWIYRNKKSLQCGIALIEKAVRKLSGCIRQIENLHPSGASNIDIINQAKMLLMQEPTYKKGFKFDHVSNLMKDFEKFKDIDTGKKKVRGQDSTLQSSESEARSPSSPIVSSPNLSSFSLNLNENFSGHCTSFERPIGVKKSKLKRSKDEGLSSAMTL
ncbi:uncharacterized protein [Solanum tuberosum]|nr:PREDICTED: uncharacterized protein LOC102604443 [Solanum tuberosum]